eukprot:GHVS01098134.1.p1 GENE.GHVS01098134.1~~GHVS01098134.1.p1  ORF type:complete len:183 (+),score=41.62 GHVS01098134.1:43-549(+)
MYLPLCIIFLMALMASLAEAGGVMGKMSEVEADMAWAPYAAKLAAMFEATKRKAEEYDAARAAEAAINNAGQEQAPPTYKEAWGQAPPTYKEAWTQPPTYSPPPAYEEVQTVDPHRNGVGVFDILELEAANEATAGLVVSPEQPEDQGEAIWKVAKEQLAPKRSSEDD